MVMQRSDFSEGMRKEMYQYHFESYPTQPSVIEKIFDVRKSTAAQEISTSIINLGEIPEKAENDEIKFENLEEGYPVIMRNRSFARGTACSKEGVDDHQKIKDFLKKAVKGWSESIYWTRQKFAAKFINEGGLTAGHDVFNGSIVGLLQDSSGDKIYDSTNFFPLTGGTNHTSKGSATYYNGFALDLNASNLETVWVHMTTTNNRNERDEIISLIPNVLLVPGGLGPTAERIIKSEWLPGTAQNDINVFKNKVEVVEWAFLDDSNQWSLGVKKKGLVFLERSEPEYDFFFDPRRKTYLATVFTRFGGGVENWRTWCSSNFDTA